MNAVCNQCPPILVLDVCKQSIGAAELKSTQMLNKINVSCSYQLCISSLETQFMQVVAKLPTAAQ